VSDDIDAITHQCWGMAERPATRPHRRSSSEIQIAELPNKVREAAFAGPERCLQAAGCELGVAGSRTSGGTRCASCIEALAEAEIRTGLDRWR
jgi:hypothetical protein